MARKSSAAIRVGWPHSRLFPIGGLLVVFVAAGLIVSTYGRLSQTVDEPHHVATGLEWLQRSSYYLWPETPPLARVSVALGPHLGGARLPLSEADLRAVRPGTFLAWQVGTQIIYRNAHYQRTLAFARLGTLSFFFLAALMVYLTSRRFAGRGGAFVSTALFCTLPPVLAHAGLATTDLPVVATFLLAAYLWVRWLDQPSPARSIALGFGVGLMAVTKFSGLVFFPAAAASLLLSRILWPSTSRSPRPQASRWRWPVGAGLAGLVLLLTIWAAYQFSWGRALDLPGTREAMTGCLQGASQSWARFVHGLARASLPAPEVLQGFFMLCAHNKAGHLAYALGETSRSGFMYFYPLALAVKTPLPFILFIAAGITMPIARRAARRGWLQAAMFAVAAVVLLLAAGSKINIGVRHVLVIYPLLAIASAPAAGALLHGLDGKARTAGRLLLAGLVVWQLAIAVVHHPHYIAYFNVFAGKDPGHVLLDSDLDWGQDLIQLEEFVADRGISHLHIAYFGTADLCAHSLGRLDWLPPRTQVSGWIAISEMYYRGIWQMMFRDPCDPASAYWSRERGRGGYRWLDRYEPVAFAGRSIRIYQVPEP